MPWRDASELYPEVSGAERSALSVHSPSTGSVALGSGAPAAASRAPETAAATPSQCSANGCTDPVSSRLTGQCEVHSERYLSDLRRYTDDIGRGEL